jgi:sugar phosphate isomerase/epimerase
LSSRRDFLTAIGGLALSCLLRGKFTPRLAADSSRPFGIQLYTLRDDLARDFEGTLSQLARIGYREIEFAGLLGHPAKDVRPIINRLGLKAPAGHYGLPAIQDTLDQTIAEAKALGHEYVITPWIPAEFRTVQGYTQMADLFNRVGKKLRAAGLRFGYHNHDFDFATLPEGGTGYDLLLERTDPRLVSMELDLFWIRKGGGDALDYFGRLPNRFRLVHIKDMAADGTMVDIGSGAMNWEELLRAARKAGVQHFLVEHDQATNPLGFARTSFEYLSRLRL